jgi:hypothetical protein
MHGWHEALVIVARSGGGYKPPAIAAVRALFERS